MLVVAVSSDWLYPPYQSQAMVEALAANEVEVEDREIASKYGHDAFLLENGQLNYLVGRFLSRIEVRDVMTTAVPTIDTGAVLVDAASVMIDLGVNHLPVLAPNGALAGIVTSWDIAKAVARGHSRLSEIMTQNGRHGRAWRDGRRGRGPDGVPRDLGPAGRRRRQSTDRDRLVRGPEPTGGSVPMRLLGIHADFFRYRATKRTRLAEEVAVREDGQSDCCVLFTCVEAGDEREPAGIVDRAADEVMVRLARIGVDRVVVYPVRPPDARALGTRGRPRRAERVHSLPCRTGCRGQARAVRLVQGVRDERKRSPPRRLLARHLSAFAPRLRCILPVLSPPAPHGGPRGAR